VVERCQFFANSWTVSEEKNFPSEAKSEIMLFWSIISCNFVLRVSALILELVSKSSPGGPDMMHFGLESTKGVVPSQAGESIINLETMAVFSVATEHAKSEPTLHARSCAAYNPLLTQKRRFWRDSRLAGVVPVD
jgi:hypothetical protein